MENTTNYRHKMLTISINSAAEKLTEKWKIVTVRTTFTVYSLLHICYFLQYLNNMLYNCK